MSKYRQPRFMTSPGGAIAATCDGPWSSSYRLWVDQGPVPKGYPQPLYRTAPTPADNRMRKVQLNPKHREYAEVLAHLQAFATPEAVAAFTAERDREVRMRREALPLFDALAEMVRTEMFLSDHPQRQAAYDKGRALLARIESGAA